MAQHLMPDLSSKSLQQALSITSLANICFNKCVIKQPSTSETPAISPKTLGILQMLEFESDDWVLGERETVCVHNCTKAYIELKGTIHNQLLKDYSHVRQQNRKLFENI